MHILEVHRGATQNVLNHHTVVTPGDCQANTKDFFVWNAVYFSSELHLEKSNQASMYFPPTFEF